jgi:hypothetical protein
VHGSQSATAVETRSPLSRASFPCGWRAAACGRGCYERTVAPAGSTPAGHSLSVDGPSTADRLKYVAALLHVEYADLGLRADDRYPVAWRGDAALQGEITRMRGNTLQSYAALLQHLIDAQLLTPDDATALGQPEVRVRVRHVFK